MNLAKAWNTDKLKMALAVSWLMTVFSSFFGSVFTLFSVPAVGAIYSFRLFLPIAAVLYVVWMIREKYNPWKCATKIQRVCYILSVLLLVLGSISLLFAIDFSFTLRRLVNLSFELCFFCLALELCKDQRMLRNTIRCILAALILQLPIGIFEVFFGGVFDPIYDTDRRRFRFFGGKFQRPVVAAGNTNDFSMMLVLMLALLLLYWAWKHREEKYDWVPVAFIAPIYFLICAGDARLCWLAFWILIAGFVFFALTLKTDKRWILLLVALLLMFVIFGNNYHTLMPKQEIGKSHAEVSATITLKAAPAGDDQKITLSSKRSLKDEIFIVDKQTGEVSLNLGYSAGTRLDLLLHTAKCLISSRGLGTGLGNTEQLAKETASRRYDGVWNIHCFLARMAADFGIFFIIPVLILVYLLLRQTLRSFARCIRARKWENAMLWMLYLTALVVYPVASTASSDAQDCLTMWLFLAIMMLLPAHFEQTQQK